MSNRKKKKEHSERARLIFLAGWRGRVKRKEKNHHVYSEEAKRKGK